MKTQLLKTLLCSVMLIAGISNYVSGQPMMVVNSSNEVPTSPTNLVALATSDTQIDLSWIDSSTNEESFSIERSLNGSDWTALTSTAANATTYSDTGLTPFTKYYYRVKAVNSTGSSEFSNTVNATTLCSIINVALNKTATASSIYSATYPASKAFDGNNNSRWAALTSVTTEPITLEVDLGGTYTFSQVVIKDYKERITSYTIQYWNGTTWLDAYTGTTIGESGEPINFPAVTGTMVRLNILTSASAPSVWEFAVNVTDCSVSGIKNVSESDSHSLSQLVAFPNPAKNNLTLSYPLSISGLTTLDFYNIAGSKIKSVEQVGTTSGSFKAEVNVNDLPNGLYIVKLINGNNIRCVKISVER